MTRLFKLFLNNICLNPVISLQYLLFYKKHMIFWRYIEFIFENAALFDIVSWNEEGTGFLVKNVLAF